MKHHDFKLRFYYFSRQNSTSPISSLKGKMKIFCFRLFSQFHAAINAVILAIFQKTAFLSTLPAGVGFQRVKCANTLKFIVFVHL